MGWIEKKLTKGFKQLKKEVPSLPVPHFYAQLSALNQSVVVGDSIVGFSIDKYMGADYPLYKRFTTITNAAAWSPTALFRIVSPFIY